MSSIAPVNDEAQDLSRKDYDGKFHRDNNETQVPSFKYYYCENSLPTVEYSGQYYEWDSNGKRYTRTYHT